jgi:tetratricopeptide (TPR) repeat protein
MQQQIDRHGGWLIVAIAAIAVYANSLANGFALDDVHIIQINGRVHQLSDQARIWLTPYWPGYGTELGLYRPLVIFMYALEWALGGGAAWVFHAFNVAFHAAASVLAYFLLRTLVGAGLPALLGGLLFAVHPVRTEAVANIVGQAELIAGIATLGACLLYATRPAGVATSWPRRAGLAILFVLAILTKESAIVLPGLLVAVDLAQRRLDFSRSSFRAYISDAFMPLFLLTAAAIAYLALRVDVLGSIGGVDAAPSLPFLREHHRIPTALRAWPEYVRLLFFPVDLSADYSPGVILPVEGMSPMAFLGALILFVTLALALFTPVTPAAGLPAAWFIVTVLPVSNLLMPVGVVVAERLLYMPAFAISLIVAFVCRALQPTVAKRPPSRQLLWLALPGVVLVLMGGRVVLRNPDWKDTPAVWEALVRDHPESYRAQWVESGQAYNAGDADQSLRFLVRANRIWPNDAQLLGELARRYIGRAMYQAALPLLERSRTYVDWMDATEVLLAQAAIGAGEYDRALEAVIRADRLGANQALTLPLYAQVFDGLGRVPEAVGAWRAVVRNPYGNEWVYWSRLARALATYNDRRGALAAADSARARLEPTDTSSLRVVRTLRDVIGRDCYRTAPPKHAELSCADPLANWRVLVPSPGSFARNSQNASGTGNSKRAAGVSGDT